MIYNAVTDFIRHNDKIAIYYKDITISYNELYNNVCRYANALNSKFNTGDKILINMSDRPEYVYLFWGAVKSGIVPVLVNTMLTDQEYAIINNTSKTVYTFNDANIEDFDSMSSDISDNVHAPTSQDDICFIMYSSGTTGFLKEIPHRHKDIRVTCENYAKTVLNISENDICLSAAKLFFAYGFGNSMSFPLYANASSILLSDPPSAKTLLDAIEQYKPTLYFAVPTLYAHKIKSLKTNKRNLSSIRLCISAGEALPATILNTWKEITNLPILDGIGTTEALHIFISNTIDDITPNSSGTLVSGYNARILDENNNEVADGTQGYLYIQGESLFTNSWMNTGDMFIKLHNKYYYQGRSNDMIKSGGIWVSPFEIESVLLENPKVSEVGVVGYSDHNSLVKPKAFVVLKNQNDNNLQTRNELIRWCIDRLSKYKHPHKIEFINELPKTATGKIQRFKLRS